MRFHVDTIKDKVVTSVSDSRGIRPSVKIRAICAAVLRLPLLLVCLLSTAIFLSSCQTTLQDIRHHNANMVLNTYRSRPAAVANNGSGVFTLHDCIRLALNSSLDLQVAAWEQKVRCKQAQSSVIRQLPHLEATYKIAQRDRPAFSRSDVIDNEGLWETEGSIPGNGVSNFSTGREHNERDLTVELKWSPMDAAIARFLARVKYNEAEYARYQRVRVAQQLMGTVIAAFHRLLALTQAAPKALELTAHHRNIVRDLKGLRDPDLVSGEEVADAQSFLAEASEKLAKIRIDIGKQRELLAVAMNVSPHCWFAVKGDLAKLPKCDLDSCKLERIALVNRPDAYQADLTYLNSIEDRKRSIAKLFPRAEGFLEYWRQENKFLLNKNWYDGGVRLTWDLMEFSANLLESEAAKKKVCKTDRERALISMAIISQVRLKSLDAAQALEELKRAKELKKSAAEKHRIAGAVETAKQQGAPEQKIRIERERALCNYHKAEIDYILALGEAHAAIAQLDVALGTNFPVQDVDRPLGPPPKKGPMRRAVTSAVGAVKHSVGFLGGLSPW